MTTENIEKDMTEHLRFNCLRRRINKFFSGKRYPYPITIDLRKSISMLIAMNRFQIVPGKKKISRKFGEIEILILKMYQALLSSIWLKARKQKTIRFTLHTPLGKAKKPLKIGQNQKLLELRIKMLGRTLICILDIRTLRVLRWLQVFQ